MLAEHYVAAYGPVTVEDLQWWTGWSVADAVAAATTVDLTATGRASELLDGVRLLPVWDVHMVAYKDRSRLLRPEHAAYFYDSSGNATSVVYDRGSVVGVWDLGKSDDPLHIKVAPVGIWTATRWREVEEQAGRVAAMVGADEMSVQRVEAPVDLTAARRNAFLAPLRG